MESLPFFLPGGRLRQLLDGGSHAQQQFVALVPGFDQLLAQTADFLLQPLETGIRLAHLCPQVIGLDSMPLGLDAAFAQLSLEFLDDLGRGILGHAPEV